MYIFYVFIKIKFDFDKAKNLLHVFFRGEGGGRLNRRRYNFRVYFWVFNSYDKYMLVLARLADFNCWDIF